MKTMKILSVGLLCILLIAVPVAADAHGGFAGAAFLGFGLGLFTGFAFAPRPVYAVPPVYYAPPPPVGLSILSIQCSRASSPGNL